MKRVGQIFGLIFIYLLALSLGAFGQNPSTSNAPIYGVNSKYTNGVAPGYWPQTGTGLQLNVSAGTADCSGVIIPYAGGSVNLTANTTNYVYLDTTASCAVSVNTTGFTTAFFPLATVVTTGSGIADDGITDVRTFFGNLGGTTTVSFNGSAVLLPNINSVTPTVPANTSPVVWACDGSGNCSGSVVTQGVTVECTGTNDQTAITTALAANSDITIIGTCNLSGHFIYYPGNTINAYSAHIIYNNPSTADFIAVNNGTLNPTTATTFTDAVIVSGNQTVTSATAAFTPVMASKMYPIHCLLAAGAGNSYDLYTFVAQYNSATSISILAKPGVSINPGTCTITVPDDGIVIRGGTWEFSGTGPTPSNSWEMLRCTGCRNFLIEDTKFIEPVGTSTGRGQIVVGNSTNVVGRNNYHSSSNPLQDGMDIFGPSENAFVLNQNGITGDDMTAFLGNPCFPLSDTAHFPFCTFGQINGGYGSQTSGGTVQGTSAYKARAGGAAGLSNITFDGAVCGNARPGTSGGFPGCAVGVNVLDEGSTQVGTQGAITNLTVNNIKGVIRAGAMNLEGTFMTNISGCNLFDDLPSTATKYLVTVLPLAGGSGSATLNGLTLCNLFPNLALTQGILQISSGATVNGANINNGQYTPTSASTVDVIQVASGGALNNLNLNNLLVSNAKSCLNYLSGSSGSGLSSINLQTFGTITLPATCQNYQSQTSNFLAGINTQASQSTGIYSGMYSSGSSPNIVGNLNTGGTNIYSAANSSINMCGGGVAVVPGTPFLNTLASTTCQFEFSQSAFGMYPPPSSPATSSNNFNSASLRVVATAWNRGIVPDSNVTSGTGYGGVGTCAVTGGTFSVQAQCVGVVGTVTPFPLQIIVTNPGVYTVVPTSFTLSGWTFSTANTSVPLRAGGTGASQLNTWLFSCGNTSTSPFTPFCNWNAPSAPSTSGPISFGWNSLNNGTLAVQLDATSGSAAVALSESQVTAARAINWPNISGTLLAGNMTTGVSGGSCAMVSATTCTVTLAHSYTTPMCLVTQQGSSTAVAYTCGVSGTTATITAGTSNSNTWGVLVFGNPN